MFARAQSAHPLDQDDLSSVRDPGPIRECLWGVSHGKGGLYLYHFDPVGPAYRQANHCQQRHSDDPRANILHDVPQTM